MSRFTYKVWGDNYGTVLHLNEVDGDGEGVIGSQLELTADVGDEELTITLGDYGVRELKLALARYERRKKG